MPESKMKSRKLWVTLIGGALLIVNEALGKPIPEGTLKEVVTALGIYVGAQAVVDGAAALKGKKCSDS